MASWRYNSYTWSFTTLYFYKWFLGPLCWNQHIRDAQPSSRKTRARFQFAGCFRPVEAVHGGRKNRIPFSRTRKTRRFESHKKKHIILRFDVDFGCRFFMFLLTEILLSFFLWNRPHVSFVKPISNQPCHTRNSWIAGMISHFGRSFPTKLAGFKGKVMWGSYVFDSLCSCVGSWNVLWFGESSGQLLDPMVGISGCHGMFRLFANPFPQRNTVRPS